MGNTINRRNKKKSVLNEREILRSVWSGIGDNPQYHGNVFFLEFCKSHPKYTKYFTLDPEMPLTIDVHISMHFSIIMEAMGYLMVDYYKNRKQQDYFIGYIAMVHKDMNLIRPDMSNFAVSLIKYLTVTFPTIMTPENHRIVSAYVSNVCGNISKNIEDLKKKELSSQINSVRQKNSLFMRWISCHDDSVYGKTVEFWIRRKFVWETRFEEWKRRTRVTAESRKKSSTTDDDVTFTQSSDDENDTSQSLEPSRTNGSSRTSSQLTLNNLGIILRNPSVMMRTKKSGETQYNTVETINHNNQEFGSNSESKFLFQDDKISSSNSYHEISSESSTQTMKNLRIDSIARKRRRERHSV